MIRLQGLYNEEIEINLLSDNDIFDQIYKYYGFDANYYLTVNGKPRNRCILKENDVCKLHLRFAGGKGGFGNMLRSIGAQIEKTTNRGACRDLSGRRMRDVASEKALRDWVEKNKDKELEKARKKQETRDRFLNPGKYFIQDTEFIKERSEVSDKIFDAVEEGACQVSIVEAESKKRKIVHQNDERLNKLFKKDFDISLSEDSDEEIVNVKINDDPKELTEFLPQTPSSIENVPEEYPSSPKLSSSQLNSVNIQMEYDDKLEPAVQQTENINIPLITNEDIEEVKKSEIETLLEQAPNLEKEVAEEEEELIDFSTIKSINELEALGLDALKHELKRRTMKCGGTLAERAKRLFAVL